MVETISDQIIDFYDALFARIFSKPFESMISDRRRLREVVRQVEGAADAASQSLGRFFLNEQITVDESEKMLEAFEQLWELLELDDISNPNVTPEEVVEKLLESIPIPAGIQEGDRDAVYRVALLLVIQVLMLVGPVMAEWQNLDFSSTFELPRRVVNRLNRITEQLDLLGSAGQEAADERYELSYRDYLLQRFHRIAAGTVKMTTKLDIDLRELFVMPRIVVRKQKKVEGGEESSLKTLMGLADARRFYRASPEKSEVEEDVSMTALEQVREEKRVMIIGTPGVGKSTLLEWLQVQVASANEELIAGDQQAIPVLLRVRQLTPQDLPQGKAIIARATVSQDRAALMPPEWLHRQMRAGRVLFMLDGLDETEPKLRDKHLFPWLKGLIDNYPDCRYVVSSRPVGYPPGSLHKLNFLECDLLDFTPEQVAGYTRNWSIAIRLAQNESEDEARREGAEDGERIVDGFRANPYISNLARNPLMLSAICLVNYFEGGQLPEDRAMLYELCVEGLIHHWDRRRGIHSDFKLDEKVRTCREVALTMQSEDKAECEAERVKEIFSKVLGDAERANGLLEHIRYRTGLLLEQRPGIFAFAHLTFQEYLAARGVYEGNQLGIDAAQLVREHEDGRWREVIALYCGLAPTPAALEVVKDLIAFEDTKTLSAVLTEAYLSAGHELASVPDLRQNVLERIAISPVYPEPWHKGSLSRFKFPEVKAAANECLGRINISNRRSEAFIWLRSNPMEIDWKTVLGKLKGWREMTPNQLSEIFFLSHALGSDEVLVEISSQPEIYSAKSPVLSIRENYGIQAEIALIGLIFGVRVSDAYFEALAISLEFVLSIKRYHYFDSMRFRRFSDIISQEDLSSVSREKLIVVSSLFQEFAKHMRKKTVKVHNKKGIIKEINSLVREINKKMEKQIAMSSKDKTKTESKTKMKSRKKK